MQASKNQSGFERIFSRKTPQVALRLRAITEFVLLRPGAPADNAGRIRMKTNTFLYNVSEYWEAFGTFPRDFNCVGIHNDSV